MKPRSSFAEAIVPKASPVTRGGGSRRLTERLNLPKHRSSFAEAIVPKTKRVNFIITQYKTISAKNLENLDLENLEIIINKSRFIARCFFVDNINQTQEILNLIKKKYYTASHNCYAYIIGENSDIMRFSDDGEPSGTAGTPILEVLKQRQLTNILVVITRYFGGTLLGAGGLIRAYSKTTSQALDQEKLTIFINTSKYSCKINYTLWGSLQNKLIALDYIFIDQNNISFDDFVNIIVFVKTNNKQEFIDNIIEYTAGKITPEFICEEFCEWK